MLQGGKVWLAQMDGFMGVTTTGGHLFLLDEPDDDCDGDGTVEDVVDADSVVDDELPDDNLAVEDFVGSVTAA